MSGPLFDELARAATRPMPRRRALRLFAAAFAATTFPGLASRIAPAGAAAGGGPARLGRGNHPCDPPDAQHCTPIPDGDKWCCTSSTAEICCPAGHSPPTCCMPGEKCCGPAPRGPESRIRSVWCCPPNAQCGEYADVCISACPDGRQECFGKCCEPDQICVSGRCVDCPDGTKSCGKECCPEDAVCVDGRCEPGRECKNDFHQVAGVQNRSGDDLGLTGKRLRLGQTIVFGEDTKIRLADGSTLAFDEGSAFTVDACDDSALDIALEKTGKFRAVIKKLVGGGDAKFNMYVPRAVVGVRGTTFVFEYNERLERTVVRVTDGSVVMRGRNGARGRVIIRRGQTGIQQGRRRPRLVRRRRRR